MRRKTTCHPMGLALCLALRQVSSVSASQTRAVFLALAHWRVCRKVCCGGAMTRCTSSDNMDPAAQSAPHALPDAYEVHVATVETRPLWARMLVCARHTQCRARRFTLRSSVHRPPPKVPGSCCPVTTTRIRRASRNRTHTRSLRGHQHVTATLHAHLRPRGVTQAHVVRECVRSTLSPVLCPDPGGLGTAALVALGSWSFAQRCTWTTTYLPSFSSGFVDEARRHPDSLSVPVVEFVAEDADSQPGETSTGSSGIGHHLLQLSFLPSLLVAPVGSDLAPGVPEQVHTCCIADCCMWRPWRVFLLHFLLDSRLELCHQDPVQKLL